MSSEEIERAVRRAEARRRDLQHVIRTVADGLSGGEGVGMIHQAVVQHYLWWYVPRDFPNDEWAALVDAAAVLLEELGRAHLAQVARSDETRMVLAAWDRGLQEGAAVFRSALSKSGVEAPDTPVLAWGAVMGVDEARALDTVERALGDAIATHELTPGAARWRARAAAITESVLCRPLDLPPGQTLAGLVTTERVGTWIDGSRHPVQRGWRSAVANRLLNPIEPPGDPGGAVEPLRWILACAAQVGGIELTTANYLARATVLEAVEHFGWWNGATPPRSETDVHQLLIVRGAAMRLHLLRRRGRRLYATARGAALLVSPERLWESVAVETEDDHEFTRAVTEVVALRLLQGRVEYRTLVADVAPILLAQGWSTDGGPITVDHVSSAVHYPLRWWRLFSAIDEHEATWEYGTARELTPWTIGLTPDGERLVLAYLRSRAAGPRHHLMG